MVSVIPKGERALSDDERAVIVKIAEMLHDAERRQQLLADAATATAIPEHTTEGCYRLNFSIAGYQRPPYEGQHSFGVSGTLSDKDGSRLWLDLYADQNDRLLELELIRLNVGDILDPQWSSLQLF